MAVAILESVESVVMLEHTYDLELAFKDNYGPILEDLNKAGLLKSDVYDAMKDPKLGSREKASLIVNSIKEYVKIQPKNYHKFITILEKSERYFYDIIRKLKKTYCGNFMASSKNKTRGWLIVVQEHCVHIKQQRSGLQVVLLG